jgi:hypothetical protein
LGVRGAVAGATVWLAGCRCAQRSYECLALGLIRACSEDLLELVDYQDQAPARPMAGATGDHGPGAGVVFARTSCLGSQLMAELGLGEEGLREVGSVRSS